MSFDAMLPSRDALRFRFRGDDVALRQVLPRATVLDWLRRRWGRRERRRAAPRGIVVHARWCWRG